MGIDISGYDRVGAITSTVRLSVSHSWPMSSIRLTETCNTHGYQNHGNSNEERPSLPGDNISPSFEGLEAAKHLPRAYHGGKGGRVVCTVCWMTRAMCNIEACAAKNRMLCSLHSHVPTFLIDYAQKITLLAVIQASTTFIAPASGVKDSEGDISLLYGSM